jgi:hypothetical protein
MCDGVISFLIALNVEVFNCILAFSGMIAGHSTKNSVYLTAELTKASRPKMVYCNSYNNNFAVRSSSQIKYSADNLKI